MNLPEQPSFSPSEVATLTGRDRRTVYRWMESGARKLTYSKLGGRIVIWREDLLTFINRRTFAARRSL